MMTYYKDSPVHRARRYARPRRDTVTLRPVGSGDAQAYRGILERTSEEDRYCRFFHVVNHFELGDIARFVEPRADTVGFIAQSGAQALGVAHAFSTGPASAEIAIVVASDARRRGVGRALIERLVGEMRDRGYQTLTACSLAGNTSFARLARSVGMTAVGTPKDIVTWTCMIAPV